VGKLPGKITASFTIAAVRTAKDPLVNKF